MAHHASVLLAPALELLGVRDAGLYVDGTLGLGGHAEAILDQSAPRGRVLGVDKDEEALNAARSRLARFGDRVETAHADFRELPELLGGRAADGILLDLGVSSLQLDGPERGFVRTVRCASGDDGGLDAAAERAEAPSVDRASVELDVAGPIARDGNRTDTVLVEEAEVVATAGARVGDRVR